MTTPQHCDCPSDPWAEFFDSSATTNDLNQCYDAAASNTERHDFVMGDIMVSDEFDYADGEKTNERHRVLVTCTINGTKVGRGFSVPHGRYDLIGKMMGPALITSLFQCYEGMKRLEEGGRSIPIAQ